MALTLEQYATAKKLDPALLAECGISEQRTREGLSLRIPYTDENGTLLATRYRFALRGRNQFRWRAGSQPQLYGLHRLEDARRQGCVVVTASESDCQTLWSHDFPAIGLPRANFWREARDASSLDGIAKIYVVAGTNDVPKWVQNSAIRERVHFVYLPDDRKDLSELHLAAPDGFATALRALLEGATPWEAIEGRRTARVERELFVACEGLAREAFVLREFLTSVRESGLAGSGRNAAMIYLALTSRLLAHPVSVAFKGPSASGKNYTVERVLAHFPSEAAIKVTSMSEKALLFLDKDLRHKHIVIAESDGVTGQFQDYLIRSLLSEGTLDYFRTEHGADGAVAKHYVRQGPTGLIITTSRASLHPDNETRVMTVETEASPHWTRAAMIAIALRKKMVKSVDPAWPALQAWLATGERRVSVPYAEALAGLMPAKAVRVRRDFMNLLSLIEAHALLQRASRERDEEGQIVATLKDYHIVSDLVEPILSSANGAAISDEMRHTVAVVGELTRYAENHLGAIAERLGVDHSTASRRCRAALEVGYLEKRKYPKTNRIEYRPGMPLPTAGARVLPTMEELEKAWRGEDAGEVGAE